MPGFLSPEATVAPPGFNRWRVPPAAIAVHLCIGEVYGFSVFNVPLTRGIGITESIPGRDWSLVEVGWIYSLALMMLGLSAALFGKWVDRNGPRRAMLAAAACFCGGLLVSAVGVRWHQLWLVYAGYGLLGGVGLGLGYIAPVSTLMKWFPDRPGMATGMAIMGFGGGAMIGAPLGVELMDLFRTPGSTGVARTLVAMSVLYAVWMLFGAVTVRVPAPGWAPSGAAARRAAAPSWNVGVDRAWRTPQFWLLWMVLCLNVTAGIGVLGQASLMCQDMLGVGAAVGGGFVGLLSLSNMVGRFLWSSVSDLIGRRRVYAIYFLLGAVLYLLVPWSARTGSRALFVAVTAVIISMYGGGFATIPAYLRDLFGNHQVGAIHGRLITAWSLAALVGPLVVNSMSGSRKAAGVPAAEAYHATLYLMAGVLVAGFVCNLLIRPVDPRHHLPADGKGGAG